MHARLVTCVLMILLTPRDELRSQQGDTSASTAVAARAEFSPRVPESYTINELRFMNEWLHGPVAYRSGLRNGVEVRMGAACGNPARVAEEVLEAFGFRIASADSSKVITEHRSGGILSPPLPDEGELRRLLGPDADEVLQMKQFKRRGGDSYFHFSYYDENRGSSALIQRWEATARLIVTFKPKNDKNNPSVRYEAKVEVEADIGQTRRIRETDLPLAFNGDLRQLWYPDQVRVAYRIAEPCGGYGFGF